MTRDQKIADLVLHGYVPYEDEHGWVALWSEERGQGSMCKFFEEGEDGPGWDVRWMISGLGLRHFDEVLWVRITDEQFEQLTSETPPRSFRHKPSVPAPTKDDPFGLRERIDP